MNPAGSAQIAQWYPRLYRTAFRLTRSADDAADVTQQTFYQALRGWDRFDGKVRPTTWLHAILLNCVRDWARRRAVRSVEPLDEWSIPAAERSPGTPLEAAQRSEEGARLRAALDALPHLRTLRQIMDEVYRLFDRRRRTETALARLARLRRRVRRFKQVGRTLSKLFTPNLEKALTFLDDRLLPATSNAVERSNRRFRKAQRSVYWVRTAEHIRQRIALDMERDQRASHRIVTVHTLHRARSENKSRNNDATVSKKLPISILTLCRRR